MKKKRQPKYNPPSLDAAWRQFLKVEAWCEETIRQLRGIRTSPCAGAARSGQGGTTAETEQVAREFAEACDSLLAAAVKGTQKERIACREFVMNRVESMRAELASVSPIVPTLSIPSADACETAIAQWRTTNAGERTGGVAEAALSIAAMPVAEASDLPADELHGDLGVKFICRDRLSAMHVAFARDGWLS